jgi:hypothetical protein
MIKSHLSDSTQAVLETIGKQAGSDPIRLHQSDRVEEIYSDEMAQCAGSIQQGDGE